MRRSRAERFPGTTRTKTLSWETYYDRDGNIHAEIDMPGAPRVHVVMDAHDWFELTEDIRQRYDDLVPDCRIGINAVPRL